MGDTEGIVGLAVVEGVLQQHGKLMIDDLATIKAHETSLRRYEATRWLRKMVGVVKGKDLPAEPSEEHFRRGLRSGIILCTALNKVCPGAVQKVVDTPLENVHTFLAAVEEMGLPAFEPSDLEKGGNSSRIVNCVLALKSYIDDKKQGVSGNSEPSSASPKTSDPFTNSISRNSSVNSGTLHMLVHELLSDKKQEDIPFIVESMLTKVMEEFEHRIASQNEQLKASHEDRDISTREESTSNITPIQMEDKAGICETVEIDDRRSRPDDGRKLMLIKQQRKYIEELKCALQAAKADLRFLQMKYREEVSNLGEHLYSLAHASSGYEKILEENRKLYNQVQDLKGNIRVYCRVRPFLPGKQNRISSVDHIDDGNIMINTPSKSGKEGKKSFTFNKVFSPSTTQGEVFADTRPLIRSVLDGYNVCIFAYGQTGSGKTHTMTGPSDFTKETVGVNYRALSDLFLISEERKDVITYDISVQMIEIYNEQVRDLLAADGLNKKVDIRNSSQNGLNVPDANLVPVKSTSDVMNLMTLGHKNRAVGATAMNDHSSRSHSCLTVHVQGRSTAGGTNLRGSMHLVDLAGSERVDKSKVVGDALKEATHINKSLSALGDVISALSQKNSHVPYRNSKLTQLLQDSLGGQAKTLMFVHISPEPDAIGETISTLKFAERVSTIELGSARANKESSDVKELKEQIASLKEALAKKEGEQGAQSRSSTPERNDMRSSRSSSWQSLSDLSSDPRQRTKDVASNMEVKKKSASKTRR